MTDDKQRQRHLQALLQCTDGSQFAIVLADDQGVRQLSLDSALQQRDFRKQQHFVTEVAQGLAHVLAGLEVAFEQIDPAPGW